MDKISGTISQNKLTISATTQYNKTNKHTTTHLKHKIKICGSGNIKRKDYE